MTVYCVLDLACTGAAVTAHYKSAIAALACMHAFMLILHDFMPYCFLLCYLPAPRHAADRHISAICYGCLLPQAVQVAAAYRASPACTAMLDDSPGNRFSIESQGILYQAEPSCYIR